jgi:hypothetical protein
MVEVFEPASTRDRRRKSHCDWPSVSQSWCRVPSGTHDQIFITIWQSRSCLCGAPSLTRGQVWLLSETLSALISNLSWCKRYLKFCLLDEGSSVRPRFIASGRNAQKTPSTALYFCIFICWPAMACLFIEPLPNIELYFNYRVTISACLHSLISSGIR